MIDDYPQPFLVYQQAHIVTLKPKIRSLIKCFKTMYNQTNKRDALTISDYAFYVSFYWKF